MVGAHVETVIHPDDMKMTSAVLAIGLHSNQMAVLDPEIRFTLRFKCALGRRNAGVTIGGFKVILKRPYFVKFKTTSLLFIEKLPY